MKAVQVDESKVQIQMCNLAVWESHCSCIRTAINGTLTL